MSLRLAARCRTVLGVVGLWRARVGELRALADRLALEEGDRLRSAGSLPSSRAPGPAWRFSARPVGGVGRAAELGAAAARRLRVPCPSSRVVLAGGAAGRLRARAIAASSVVGSSTMKSGMMPLRLDRAAARRVVARGGELDRGVVAERQDGLHRALAEGLRADHAARLWSCSAPATISEAEAEPPLTSTTIGTVFDLRRQLLQVSSSRAPRR